jgi:hypothetical protein
MKNILFYMINLPYCVLLTQPLWAEMYLEYEDERSLIRTITVDFTKDLDVKEENTSCLISKPYFLQKKRLLLKQIVE